MAMTLTGKYVFESISGPVVVPAGFQLNETASQVSSLLCITPSGHVTMAMTLVLRRWVIT